MFSLAWDGINRKRQRIRRFAAARFGTSSLASTLDALAMSRYRTQSPDTSVAAERVQVRRYREMSPAEKLRIFRQLSRTTQELALAGLRRRFPAASTRELQLRLAATRLDRETLRAAFDWSDSQ